MADRTYASGINASVTSPTVRVRGLIQPDDLASRPIRTATAKIAKTVRNGIPARSRAMPTITANAPSTGKVVRLEPMVEGSSVENTVLDAISRTPSGTVFCDTAQNRRYGESFSIIFGPIPLTRSRSAVFA